MPAKIEKNVSPSCRFNVIFCKKCSGKIDDDDGGKCDGCGNQFHNKCIMTDNGAIDVELIHLCRSCEYDQRICTAKLGPKVATKRSEELLCNENIKSLRNRAISMDTRPIQTQSKAKKVVAQNEMELHRVIDKYEERLKMVEAKIEELQNKPCKCIDEINVRIDVLKRKIEANQTNQANHHDQVNAFMDKVSNRGIDETQHTDVSKQIEMLNETMDRSDYQTRMLAESVKDLNALLDLDATNDSMVQGQFDALNNKIDEESSKNNIIREIQNELNYNTANALKQHNRTIMTHFNLNDGYCSGIMSKFDVYYGGMNDIYEAEANESSSYFHEATKSTEKKTNVASTSLKCDTDNEVKPSIQASANHSTKNIRGKHSNNNTKVYAQPLTVNGRNDYKRVKVNVINAQRYGKVSEIHDMLDCALTSYTSISGTNERKIYTTKHTYDPATLKLNECTVIIVLSRNIKFAGFVDFLNGFFERESMLQIDK